MKNTKNDFKNNFSRFIFVCYHIDFFVSNKIYYFFQKAGKKNIIIV